MEISVDQLRVVGAKDDIKDDFSLVSCLIQKLHYTHQEEWDGFLEDHTGTCSLWDKFIEFLTEKNKKAIRSQMRCLSVKSEAGKANSQDGDIG